jgi:hypothetical protein
MTFTDALIASGYYFQPETGAFWKEDNDGNVHSYLNIKGEEWSYEKYSEGDDLLTSKVFSLI